MKWDFDHDEEHLIVEALKHYHNMLGSVLDQMPVDDKEKPAPIKLKGKVLTIGETLTIGRVGSIDLLNKMEPLIMADCPDKH